MREQEKEAVTLARNHVIEHELFGRGGLVERKSKFNEALHNNRVSVASKRRFGKLFEKEFDRIFDL